LQRLQEELDGLEQLGRQLQEGPQGQDPAVLSFIRASAAATSMVGSIFSVALTGWASVAADTLLVQEEVKEFAKRVKQVEQSVARRGSGGSSAADKAAMAALTTQVERLGTDAVQLGVAVDKARSDAKAALGYLQKAGLTSGDSAKQLQDAADKGAQAYMQQDKMRRDVKALQRSVKELQEEQQRLRTQQAAQGAIGAWAPVDWSADRVCDALVAAGTVSRSSILSVAVVYKPKVPGGSFGAAGAGAGRGGSSSSSREGQGAAGEQRRGGAAAAAGGGGQGDRPPGGGSGKQPNALFKVLLRSRDLEFTVLGGRTRSSLAHQRLPVFVEKLLTEEERAERKSLQPTYNKMKAQGKMVRWDGAVLQVQVQSRSGGRKGYWENVQLAPEPRSPRGAGLAAAATAEAGDELIGGDADRF
jgi:hypothetical protein